MFVSFSIKTHFFPFGKVGAGGGGGGMNLQLRVIFSSLVIPGCCYPLKIIPIINYYFLFNTLLKLDIEYMTFVVVVVVIAVVVAVKKSLKRNFFSSNNFQRVTNLEKR